MQFQYRPVAVDRGSCAKASRRDVRPAGESTELRGTDLAESKGKALQFRSRLRLPVLMYHHVGPRQPGTHPELTVSPERFERHVRWLARRGYTGIRPADWARWRHDSNGVPDKPLLLTFDDGYTDLAEYALPVLRRYGFSAAVYIVTGQLGGTNAWNIAQGSAPHRLLTAEQIQYWAAQGIEFGAHSRTHADLTTLSARELEHEVMGSAEDLATLLGSRVVSFAYPYGFLNSAVVNCVKKSYDLAFSAGNQYEGLNHLLTNPHVLSRTMVQTNDSLLDLECRARWGYSPILRLRTRLRLGTRIRSAANFVSGRHS